MQDASADRPPDAEADLQQLVRRCLDGEPAAHRAFVKRFERAVFGLCLRMLRHREDAEDIVQETFVRAIRNLHRWDPDRPLLPWLQTIAANRCRTALGKRERRARTISNLPEVPVAVDSTEDVVEEVDLAINQLPENYQQVVVMYYRGGLGCLEIADVLGCAEGTVKTWLFRARKQLAEMFRERGFGEEATNDV